MKKICFLVVVIAFSTLAYADYGYKNFEFRKIQKIDEVSGASFYEGKYYLVSDRNDPNIYENDSLSTFTSPVINISALEDPVQDALIQKYDFESIEICNDVYYLANERKGEILRVKESHVDVVFQYQNLTDESKNKGIEGIAIDCEKQKMYLVKQKNPTLLITVNMRNWKVEKQVTLFNDTSTSLNNISDARVKNGRLFFLHKDASIITEYNFQTGHLTPRISFTRFGHLFEKQNKDGTVKTKFCEAFVIHDDHVDIFFDLSPKTVVTQVGQSHGLTTQTTTILSLYY
ncbi:MAG: SdiA-regulated domain-containing protein [Bdellovibrionales bacterium]|nr:SdiA-regulated domain-containing protein [Bdellovibrionales bacterium]